MVARGIAVLTVLVRASVCMDGVVKTVSYAVDPRDVCTIGSDVAAKIALGH